MIKNEKQYRITQAQAKKFEAALILPTPQKDIHPKLMKAQREAMKSQLQELRRDLRSYERLRQGKRKTFEAASLEELATILIQARIASNLSQKDLAERLELNEQQIQRYESSEYASASLDRLHQVAEALKMSIHAKAKI
jgi:ribosome-binding protein aMBF1 (putative translation factor)